MANNNYITVICVVECGVMYPITTEFIFSLSAVSTWILIKWIIYIVGRILKQ
jgi:hypothetical protein